MHRALTVLVVPALVAVAAGCGRAANGPGPSGGASVAPRSTAVLIRADTSPDSPAWDALPAIADLLPEGVERQALDRLRGAVGPETDLLALTADDLDAGTVIGLTQPPDQARLDSLLTARDPALVSEPIGDWRVVAADRGTIDRLKRARNEGSLAASAGYRAATAGLPSGALASVYVDGGALGREVGRRAKTGAGPVPGLGRIDWLAGAVSREQGGLSLHLRLKGDEIEATRYAAALPAEIPAPVGFLVDAKGLDATLEELRRSPALSGALGQAAKLLGGTLDEVVGLFRGEAAFYVRPLPAGPEYTLVLQVGDEAGARATLDTLTTLAGALSQKLPTHPVISGLPVTRLDLGSSTLYAAVAGGKVVLTSAPSGIRGLTGSGPRLTDTALWQRAVARAGMPDETTGFAYGRPGEALPLLSGLTGSKTPDDAGRLGTGLVYGSVSGSVLTVRGFVAVR